MTSNPPLLKVSLAIFFANLFDAVSTVFLVTEGLAYELNPIARVMLVYHPALFLWLKVIVGCIFFKICIGVETKWVQFCVGGILTVYTGIALLHAVNWLFVLNIL